MAGTSQGLLAATAICSAVCIRCCHYLATAAAAAAELMAACWAADPFSRPSFAAVEAQLAEQLTSVMQDSREARERFISDL